MKKIIVGILSFAMLISAQNVFAAGVTWNTASNDCKSISIINATTNQGYQNPCWPLSSVSASGGDTINVRIYYHNTGTVTATNTRIVLLPSSSLGSSSTTKSFTGRIVSDQGSISFGPVTANISSSQSLTFLSTKWYTNNTSETLTPLLNGQSGSEVLTDNGLAIGSITAGWPSQGSVVVAFKLSSVVAPQLCQDTSATNYGGPLPCTYPPQLCQDPNANNYGGPLPCVYPNPVSCTISNFSANPSSITKGDLSYLNWSTSNCSNVTISNLGYGLPLSGSQSVWPTQTMTYTMTANGVNGVTQTRSATVYVNNDNNDCSITSFTASDTSIEDGDSTILRWNTNNCDRVKLSGFSGNVDEDGSKTVYPSYDTTYVLTAYDDNGNTETDSVRIYVDEDNNDDNNDFCYINSFTSNKTYINSGDPVLLQWNTTDCDDVNISNVGDVNDDGSRTIYPTSTRTYTLRASGENTVSRSITVNVNYYNPPVVPIYNANVVTTVATNISQTGAQVNGLITSSNYTNTNVYFEYGTNINLGLRTNSRTTNGNTNFSEYLTGLSSNTIYYFQAVSEGANGVSRGAIEVFKTLGYPTIPVTPIQRVIIQGPTVTSSTSPIVLRIENRYQTIGIGDVIDYTVYYKNISNSKLTNPMVQVFVPKGITFMNTSRGTYSESERTLSVPIEDLSPSAEGVIYLQGRVDDIDTNLAQVVTTAILVYTNPNGAQENAMAYVLNNPKVVNLLGASAFFGNIFGLGLIGWLLLILFIMVLILIARSFYGNRNTSTPTHTNN